ncbi:hypothetical protein Agabi119p4_11453 [Agaricus bisporus var. burnettii]|uniref:VHS domain-containing protein n=1 Tax=Agaricus bisporus var. burnettii TaxID=192524 RepID=A0A8H7EUB9_AGABI|nr:hypothetical protein Agabi119p4_11453 [Agaricus bisporus var. burnettii]
MRRLFKAKTLKPKDEPIPTPIYLQHASQPVAPRILSALDAPPAPILDASEDGLSSLDMPLHRKTFWSRDRSNDHHDPLTADLTKMIAYLTATGCQDSSLVSDVCYRASQNDASAKEAIRVLRREFKYGEPPGQLSAARLWAVMLHNCSDLFIFHSTSRKFLDTVHDLLTNPKTSPVVRERLLDVIAAAAFATQSKKNDRDGFRALWRRVKPADKPDEGMPLSDDDTMLNPPLPHRTSPSAISTPEPPFQSLPPSPQIPPPLRHKNRKSPTRNRIIPHEEDVKRLLQECKIGQGNATLLSQALFHAKLESFKKDTVIREFYRKCRASHELLVTQIPWATAEAEKSIIAKEQESSTKEEHLLASILAAHGELVEVLNQYEDLSRVALERKVEHRSLREVRMEVLEPPIYGDRRSRSSSLSARTPSPQLQRNRTESVTGSLAPPPSAPCGPRSPNHFPPARTPSPQPPPTSPPSNESEEELDAPRQLSAKALGKQRAVDIDSSDPYQQQQQPDTNDSYYDVSTERRNSHSFDESDREDPQNELPWHRPTHYVYDAAAERNAQRERQTRLVNGVH